MAKIIIIINSNSHRDQRFGLVGANLFSFFFFIFSRFLGNQTMGRAWTTCSTLSTLPPPQSNHRRDQTSVAPISRRMTQPPNKDCRSSRHWGVSWGRRRCTIGLESIATATVRIGEGRSDGFLLMMSCSCYWCLVMSFILGWRWVVATISDGFCFEFQFTDLDVIFWVVCGVFKEDVVFVYPESGRKKRKKNELEFDCQESD